MSRRATLGGLSQSTLNTRGGSIGGGLGGSRQSLGPPQISSETLIKPSNTMITSTRRPSNPRNSSAGIGQRYYFF